MSIPSSGAAARVDAPAASPGPCPTCINHSQQPSGSPCRSAVRWQKLRAGASMPIHTVFCCNHLGCGCSRGFALRLLRRAGRKRGVQGRLLQGCRVRPRQIRIPLARQHLAQPPTHHHACIRDAVNITGRCSGFVEQRRSSEMGCAHRDVAPGSGGQQADLEQRAGVPAVQDGGAQRAGLPPVVHAVCHVPHRPQLPGRVVRQARIYRAQPARGTGTGREAPVGCRALQAAGGTSVRMSW